jgi:hypothetical protein
MQPRLGEGGVPDAFPAPSSGSPQRLFPAQVAEAEFKALTRLRSEFCTLREWRGG